MTFLQERLQKPSAQGRKPRWNRTQERKLILHRRSNLCVRRINEWIVQNNSELRWSLSFSIFCITENRRCVWSGYFHKSWSVCQSLQYCQSDTHTTLKTHSKWKNDANQSVGHYHSYHFYRIYAVHIHIVELLQHRMIKIITQSQLNSIVTIQSFFFFYQKMLDSWQKSIK